MKQLFINLPVKNLEPSMHFYTQLGFTNYPLFTDDSQKCVVWGEQIYVMLQSHEMFLSNTEKTVPDTQHYVTAKFTLPLESLDMLNKIMEKGLQAGGIEPLPMQDEGFIQIRSLEDLDGHRWDIIYLDIEKFKELKTAQ
ncbi:MAG: glyoxalase/bleomycin resistance/extradiol dioxygenase family protein [Allomuricauda sp.]